jgi:hypothetical protein
MVKSLFDLSLAVVCQEDTLCDDLAALSCDCKQKMLEYFTSHDKVGSERCAKLFANPLFGCNLTKISFYLTEHLTDDILAAMTGYSHMLEQISLIDCRQVTDQGVIKVTANQTRLRKLELRSMRNLTSQGLQSVKSPVLFTVDLSGCSKVTSEGVFYLVFNNPSIHNLYLNNCRSLDDQALYDIAHGIGENLVILQLDFLPNVLDPAAAIFNLSQHCPNIAQLSLCRFFEPENDNGEAVQQYRIEGVGLRDLDLYGNYFTTLPALPPTVHTISISVTGKEDVIDLVQRLSRQSQLKNIHLQLDCADDAHSVESANRFLCIFIPYMGKKITRLHIATPNLTEPSLALITQSIPNLRHLALDGAHLSAYYLRRFFAGGKYSPGARLLSLKLCDLRLTNRALFAIARGACSLTDLETSKMTCVDDRFLIMLAENCKTLRNINFNGCKWVTDKGMAALAR